MNYRAVTRALVLCAVALIGLYDVLPFWSPVDGDTVSEVVRDAGMQSPAVPWGVGFLVGHFFWPGERELSHAAAIGFGVGAGVVLHLFAPVFASLPAASIVVCAVGAFCGHLVWPLEREKPPDE
jgi:hypothetical protein